MKKIVIRASLLFCIVVLNLSLTCHNADDILTEDDMRLEEEQEQPALSSGYLNETFWESFNEWQCFDTRDVRYQ